MKIDSIVGRVVCRCGNEMTEENITRRYTRVISLCGIRNDVKHVVYTCSKCGRTIDIPIKEENEEYKRNS